jgi:short-subunit dehydrogenase
MSQGNEMAKTVFITGASSGLGKGMAFELASRGYNLALAARRSLQDTADEIIQKHGVKVKVYELDVTDYDAIDQCVKQVVVDFSVLDIVIANAGIGETMYIGKSDFSAVKATIETNVLGLMATVESVLPILRQQGHGQIVGISSVAGERGMPGVGVYCASKSAVTTYLKTLQVESYRENIDITILAPGYIDTPINQGAKSRPFVVSLDKGVLELVDKIEKKVAFSFVPSWPWSIVARVMRYLPHRMLAK